MSIINQTLRELDARRNDSVPVPAPTPLQPLQHALRRRSGLWGAAAALLAVVGGMVWALSRPADSIQQAPAVLSSRAVAPQAAMPAAAGPPASPVPAIAREVPAIAHPETLAAVSPDKRVDSEARGQVLPKPDKAGALSGPAPTLASATISESSPVIRKENKPPTAEEEAGERYRKAMDEMQKGRYNQVRPLLEEALRLFPGHLAARQTFVALLSEAGQNIEAEAVLREGRVAAPGNAWFTLSLARLQAARGDAETAVATLQSGIASRGGNAEYHATLAGLLLQLKRHPEAARQYQLALRLQPEQAAWWLGLGLALAAQGQSDEARAAYGRALAAGNLPEKLLGFVRAKLAE